MWKISLTVEYVLDQIFCGNFLDQLFYGKISWLWKIYLMKYIVENFCDCGKYISSIFFVENFLDQIFWGKIHELWKINLLKLAFLTAKSNSSNNFETIKTSIFNIEQKLSSLSSFFVVHKINSIFSIRFKHKYCTFNSWKQQKQKLKFKSSKFIKVFIDAVSILKY